MEFEIPSGGQLFSVGDYSSYRRGTNTSSQRVAPVENNIQGVIHISCGWYHNVLYTNNNIWWGFGENGKGELDIRHHSCYHPKQLEFWSNIRPLWFCCADSFTVIIDQNKKLYCCGESKPSQLTEFGNIPVPVIYCDCGSDSIAVIPEGKGLYYFSNNSSRSKLLSPEINFIECACSSNSLVAIDNFRRIWALDRDSSVHELHLIKEISNITNVYGFSTGAFAISDDNNIYYKGSNYNGMGGVNTSTKTFILVPFHPPEKVKRICGSNAQSFIFTTQNKVYSAGSTSYDLLMRSGSSSFQLIDYFNNNDEQKSITCIGSGLFHALFYVNGPTETLSNLKNGVTPNCKKLHLYE